MEEDTEFKKLPVEEQCVHKLWKARLHGYEETIKIFRQIDDEKSPEWNRFVFLLKKFVVDAHAMAQERGLEATLICVENCSAAGKVAGEVLSGVVQKCIAAQKTKTRELAVQVVMMYVEIERQETVVEELIKGMEHKNPKIVAACTAAVAEALREFGHKVVAVKPLVKQIGRLLSDRDKAVRTEGKTMTVEIYRWIGDALKPQLASLPAVVVAELEAEFAKMGKDKPEPTRYLKSQQAKAAQLQAAAGAGGDGADGTADADDDGDADAEEIDPMDLIDPVDILAKLPKDFYEKLEEKKWQTRKEALEALDEQLKNPKLMPGDYGELVKALKKVLSKDSNVVLVAMAGKSLAALARGLGKKFAPYSGVCVAAILEKFKEKKANVVAALRDAIDSIYPSTTLEAMQEDLLEALANKNPSVKSETCQFLARSIARTLPTVFNKKLLKALTVALLKTLNESDPAVRDGSAEALGMLQKLLGEKVLAAYLVDVDALKLAKVKECADKAVVLVKVPQVKKAKPVAAAPPKAEPSKPAAAAKSSSTAVKRPATSGVRKQPAAPGKKTITGGGGGASSSTPTSSAPKQLPTERDLTPEEVCEAAADLLPGSTVADLSDANWKQRLAAADAVLAAVGDMTDVQPLEHSQVLFKVLCLQKPGLKDSNMQVVRSKLQALQLIVEKMGVSVTTADAVVNDIVERLSDAKNVEHATPVLSALAESLHLQYVVSKVLGFAFEQKSPKVQSESLKWVTRAVQEFGMQVNPKVLIDDLRKAVASTNPTVRGDAIAALGTLHLYTGDTLMMFFEAEKPAVRNQIQAEFDKNVGKKAPAAIRGPGAKPVSNGEANGGGGSSDANGADDEVGGSVNLMDMLPRVDLGAHITEPFLAELSDKDWKTRMEALTKLNTILNESQLIGPNIGDLPHSLGQRLVDSNAKIAQTALAICQQLAVAMGAPCRQYVRAFFPGFLNGLGDNKQFIRAASITCMNVWGDQAGYKEFFDGEMIATALGAGSPALRAELWCWLAEKMPLITPRSLSKDELTACLPHLYTNVCDRSADVRKHASDAVYGFMLHLGYETMAKGVERVKPSSKKDVQAVLDKTRPNLPVKPLPVGKQQAPIADGAAGGRGASAGGARAAGPSKIQKAASGAKLNVAPTAATASKKDEEVDMSPMLTVNNLKNQRMLDEQKLKVLKWSFTSPREEFIELLRDQMTAAGVNKGLLANMFHADFRYHLKAMETLQEDLNANGRALICNLDLVLKWISLRFYDTNPSVLLKGLEYLCVVFTMLDELRYSLAEAEGSCFIPHLLIKIGDPKDSVRSSVRNILSLICKVYPETKVFAYTMEGLKSKNARQRTECLDELGGLIYAHGINVCQPTPAAALKEVARHIGDRDNSVRSAALNCIVTAHTILGERVHKMIGNLSEKDTSMLEERIKRAAKTKPREQVDETVVSPPLMAVGGRGSVKAERSPPYEEDASGDAEMEADESGESAGVLSAGTPPSAQRAYESPVAPAHTVIAAAPKPSGPFKLDQDVIDEIEKDWVRVGDQPAIPERPAVDLGFMHSPLKIVEIDGTGYPRERLDALLNGRPLSAAAYAMGGGAGAGAASMDRPRSPQQQQRVVPNLANELPKQLDPVMVRHITNIGHANVMVARAAMNALHDILENPEKSAALRDYEDVYIESICAQFKLLSQKPTSESLTMYQPVLSSVYLFFTAPALGKSLSIESLKLIMSVLIGLMADNKLTTGEDGQYTKVLNGVCLRILERSNFSNLNCALIRLLKESCTQGGLPKFTELLMKCIWRNVKVMPEKAHELDYRHILLEIHGFMTLLPSTWWSQRPVDTPLRTVKTIIHNMTKLKGRDILADMGEIPPHSELLSYVMRVLKNINKTPTNVEQAAATTLRSLRGDNKHISKETHEAMSAIFKKIATKDQSKAGIAQLHEYKKQNPQLDLAHFLEGADPMFVKFIEDGLAEIEQNPQTASTAPNVLAETNKDAEYYQERLRVLRSITSDKAAENNENQFRNVVISAAMPLKPSTTSMFTPEVESRVEQLRSKLSKLRPQKPL